MNKRFLSIFMICGLCAILTACGPSEKKVAEAQQKYTGLVDIHNQVVEAHKDVADNSLDEALTNLREKIEEVQAYNLNEMKDEEIDTLIQIMDALISEYEEYLATLVGIKEEEDAAVLTPISITVTNQTDFSFSELKLYEAGDMSTHEDVLDGIGEFVSGETLTGLIVQRNVDNTPWILALVDAEGTKYELELPVGEYGEDGVVLSLNYDSEGQKIRLDAR